MLGACYVGSTYHYMQEIHVQKIVCAPIRNINQNVLKGYPMSTHELFISGLGISQNVLRAIVVKAVSHIEGVAQVGGNDITSSLISVFTTKSLPEDKAVEARVEDDKLFVDVHVAVFYGYPFVGLAQEIRSSVATALQEQLSCEIGAIDVYIDSLVFPKE